MASATPRADAGFWPAITFPKTRPRAADAHIKGLALKLKYLPTTVPQPHKYPQGF